MFESQENENAFFLKIIRRDKCLGCKKFIFKYQTEDKFNFYRVGKT